AELLKQLGRNRRQSRRLGFRFARHKLSLGACYALNTKFLTGPRVAFLCAGAAALLPLCAVIAASAASRDHASTPIPATPRPAHQPPTDRRILDRRNITTPIHDHQRRPAQKPKQQAIPTRRNTNRSES
ncbi:hypothetical protein, partial [Burkholderia multivorans]|uniref:hypothetical protein n=1 Tax=Burkholderia multivorans TaxID=87883 RepID=UPI00287046C3